MHFIIASGNNFGTNADLLFTHLPLDKMVAFSPTIFSYEFSRMKSFLGFFFNEVSS